jgi:hypothetical protein
MVEGVPVTQPIPPTDTATPPEPVVVEELTPVEAAFYALVLAALGAWLAATAAKVLSPWNLYRLAPNPAALWSLIPDWTARVRVMATWLREEAAPEGWSRWFRERGGDLDIPFPSTDAFIASHIAQVENYLVRIPEEVFNLVMADVVDGHNAGESFEDIAARIEDTLNLTGSENWPARARVIAVTECLPGDAVVDSARITAAYRRWYEGDWIEVRTESGNQFSGTPNHPVLTARGWVGLGALQEGDHLIRDSVQQQDPIVPLNPYVEAVPATIAEVFDSLSAVILPGRIGTGEPDFHGDGMEGYVDVLRPDRPLLLGDFSPVTQGRVEGVLEGSDVDSVMLAARGHVFPKDVGPSQLRGLADGSNGKSGRLYDETDDAMARVEGSREGPGGFAAPVPLHDFLCWQGVTSWPDVVAELGGFAAGPDDSSPEQDPVHRVGLVAEERGDSPVGHSGPVKLDDVVSVVRTHGYSGHVYNLTTMDGYFVSNGVYTGNTNGTANAGWLAAAFRTEELLGVTQWKKWLQSHDRAVRADHRIEQKRPVREPFFVGGEYLMVPGAKNGSPENIINCRCAPGFTEAPRGN